MGLSGSKNGNDKNDGDDAVIGTTPSPSEREQFAAAMGSDTPWHYTFMQRGDRQGKIKAEGDYLLVVGRPEPDAWEEHLRGRTTVAIVLNCADEEGRLRLVRRAVLDVDEYGKEKQKQLLRKIKKKKLPCLVTQSKSGGSHINIFFDESIDAERAQRLCRQIGAEFELEKFEVFPKQIEVSEDGNRGNGSTCPVTGPLGSQ